MSLLTRVGWRRNGTLVARRPGGNFIEGANVSIAAVDNPSNGVADYTISATGSLSAVPVFGLPDGVLVAGISAGAFTVKLTGIPDGMFNSKGVLISVGTGANTEVRRVASLAADTFTTNQAFKRAHSAGEPVRWLRDNRITPLMYGATYKGDTSEDWAAWQRAVLDQSRAGGGAYVDGLNFRSASSNTNVSQIGQPLIGVGSLDIRDFSLLQRTPLPETPEAGKTYLFPWVRNWCDFTATAADNKIHITTADSFDSTSVVYFNDPAGDGANFPAGMASGRRYYMQNVLALGGNQFTFTLSTDAAGLNPVDITGNGSGVFYFNPNSTNKVYVQRGYIRTITQDVGGMRCCPEQPSHIDDLNIELRTAASAQDAAIGLQFSPNTQYCNIKNLEINPAPNNLGMDVAGTGVVCSDKITMNEQGAACRVTGNDHYLKFLIERAHHPAGVRMVGDVRNVTIGYSYFSPENDDPFIDDQCGGNSSWVSEGGQTTGAGITIFRDSSSYGDLLSGPDGITFGDHHVWSRVEKIKDGSGHNGGLQFVGARGSRTMSGNFTASPNIQTYLAHSNGITATLKSFAGLAGTRHTFRPKAGVTGYAVKPATGQSLTLADGSTVTGPSTYAVPTAGVTIEATDGGWAVVA